MSGAPSMAIGSQRNPATSVPSASCDAPDAERRRDLVDERPEAGGVELPHLDLDRAGAVDAADDLDQARLRRIGRQRVQR